MRLKAKILALLLTLLVSHSCKKTEKEHCWQVLDTLGNPVNSVCSKSEAEMQATYPDPCRYYKLGDKFCWLVDGTIFIKDVPEDYVNRLKNCHGYTSVLKVPCDYCQKWYTRQKNTHKPTNSFAFSPIKVQQYCGDTAQTLYHGRVIVLRETTDSLITVQFSNNGVF